MEEKHLNVINIARYSSHPQNKPHAHRETHFHTMKDVTILIPSFHGLRYERGAYKLGPTEKKTAF